MSGECPLLANGRHSISSNWRICNLLFIQRLKKLWAYEIVFFSWMFDEKSDPKCRSRDRVFALGIRKYRGGTTTPDHMGRLGSLK